MLKYLRSAQHEEPCPWDTDTLKSAAFGGHFDCYNWAKQNGCPAE